MALSRRSLLLAAGAAAAVLGVPRALRHFAPLPPAEPIPGLPGFRRIESGGITLPPALAGMEGSTSAGIGAEIAAVRRDPAAALFGAPRPGTVPVAVFTDVNCPNCRQIEPLLLDWAENRQDRASMAWHELPLLGPTSESAARAALAAGLQGGYLPVHARLMQSRFRPSPAYLRDLAQAAGLDADRMAADMQGPEVEAALRHARALAHVFAIPGTPALAIGRTLAIGALGDAQMNRLLSRAATA
ncbi:DsbA family protein [Mangrovicoccus sp. HB161399]|uniref:DsbA family protein n=1 Tax=Mangrovicoccus sp. HB161399 TaxID=2720392 RepID=UPI001554FB25|nr:DsbA family protein [Mangrovicoccus sp. HB161399]